MLNVKHIPLVAMISLTGVTCRASQSSDAVRIHTQNSSTLVDWLNWERVPKDLKDRDMFFWVAIGDELTARREVGFLLASLNSEHDEFAHNWLISHVLFQIDDGRVYDNFMRRLNDTLDEGSFYIALYLAQRGNTAA